MQIVRMSDLSFQTIVEYLGKQELSINDRELVFDIPGDIEPFKEALKKVGYLFDEARTFRSGKAHISLNAPSWESTCFIYETWASLFSIIESTSRLPERFFVVETNESSLNESVALSSLNLFCAARKLLVKLADQKEPAQGNAQGSRRLFFIIETEEGVAKYEFKPTISWDELLEIRPTRKQVSLIEKMIYLTEIGDSQDTERSSVMRSAFHELISTCFSEQEIFKHFLSSVEHFHKRYEEHHDLFVKRFSINKVLHEINEQDLTYTSKINEILSSAQNKALTIPGALIVIGAVMKIDHWVDGLAVAVGIFITTIIVHRSLGVHDATFDHIQRQVEAEFKRYDVLSEEVEVRKRAKLASHELKSLLTKALANAQFMKSAIWFIFNSSLLFILFVTLRVINE